MAVKNLSRLSMRGGHAYRLDGARVPSVTGVVGLIAKPALVRWAANEAADYAIDHWAELAGLPMSDRRDRIAGAAGEKNRKAKTRGIRIHTLGERILHGDEVEVPDEIQGPVEAYARFLDDWGMESILTESVVYSSDYRFAGRLDAVVRSPKLGTILMDAKSGSGPWPETALQLAGYRHCDGRVAVEHSVGPKGGKIETKTDAEMITVDGCYVAQIRSDTVDLHPVRAEAGEWATFLYLREALEWHRAATKSDSEEYDPPIDEATYPENHVTDPA